MLKNIDPLLNPDLLRVLAMMGHGDRIVVADANFPAASVAAGTPFTEQPCGSTVPRRVRCRPSCR